MKIYMSLLAIISTFNLHALTQIWMSGVGDDINPGSRPAPVLTIANALFKTNRAGQISPVDPGNFFSSSTPIIVTQSVTIDGTALPTQVLLDVAGTGITVSAGPNDVIILRHLLLNGTGLGTTGIQFISGAQLIIEDCKIINFTGTGIDINLTNAGSVVIKNSSIGNVSTGIKIQGSMTPLNVCIDNIAIQGTTTAVNALIGNVNIANSFILQNKTGVIGSGTSVVSCANSLFASNTTAIQSTPRATVQIANNDFYDNSTNLDNSGGGNIATANNNRTAGSATQGSPTSAIVFQ